MRLIFQNPLWLLGALIAIPLLAHLFSRARPRRREYPSLRLLREAMRRVTRVRQPRDRWLLALRTLAIAALVLAFLQPLLLSRFAAMSNAAKTALLVVDVSASMAYADGTRTRLAQAAAAAEEVLATLPANSKANVIWVRGRAASALPEPSANLEFLRQGLRQATARPEAGDIAGALALALKQLGEAEGVRELVVISDFQKSAWRETSWEMPVGVQLTRIAVGQEEAANVALADLAVEPARPVTGQEARLVCRVRNLSAEPHRVTVFAEAGESRLSQAVEAAPWSETLAILPVKFAQEGLVPVKATLTEDRFPGDDVRYGLAEVRGALQITVVGAQDDATADAWERAARALDAVTVRHVAADRAESPDVLFVAGWNGDGVEALRAQLRAGALVVQPAENLPGEAVRALLGGGAELNAGAAISVEMRDAPGWGIRITDEQHPMFGLFASGAFGDPVNARFRRRLTTPGSLERERPLLTFEDGRAALTLIDAPAGGDQRGLLAWWNLDLGASDWPSRTAFVPFFGEFLRHVAGRTGTRTLRVFAPGEPLRFDTPAAVDPADVRLVDEREQLVPAAAESPRAPGRLATMDAAVPGSYRWTAQGGVLERVAVNFPETESDLRRLTEAELGQGTGNVISAAARARLGDLREGRPLWPWCLAAAALFLLLEGVCLRRFHAVSSGSPRAAAPARKEQTLTVA